MHIKQIYRTPASWPATLPLPVMSANNRPARRRRSRVHYSKESTTVGGRQGGGNSSPNGSHTSPRCLSQSTVNHRRPRVALYSHDTMGLGHLRRNLLIAQSLSQSPLRATSLLITGAHEANFFSLPPGIDCLTLPRLRKGEDGSYEAGQLAMSIDDLICLRSEAISSALATFQPDVLIVDKVPTGAFGEMLPALQALKQNCNTRCVLGVRDVLDDPETVRLEWSATSNQQAIQEYFDEIWVYGDRHVYDPIEEYSWPVSMAGKTRFTGYLNQESRLSSSLGDEPPLVSEKVRPNQQLIVCTLGGGQDGYEVAKAFVDAMPMVGYRGVLLAGPFMPTSQFENLQAMANSLQGLEVLEFTPDLDQLMSQADRVIAMGGYNTVCSILSFAKKALVVPRVFPRQEQWIRAQRMEEMGLLDVLHPKNLSSATLQQWISGPSCKPGTAINSLDLSGFEQVQTLLASLLQTGKENLITAPAT